MLDDIQPIRGFPRALVILTALLCLGVGGYAGQVEWARHVARDELRRFEHPTRHAIQGADLSLARILKGWMETPWYGHRSRPPSQGTLGDLSPMFLFVRYDDSAWIPRRAYRELAVLVAGEDLGNDPAKWESWLKAHPNLRQEP